MKGFADIKERRYYYCQTSVIGDNRVIQGRTKDGWDEEGERASMQLLMKGRDFDLTFSLLSGRQLGALGRMGTQGDFRCQSVRLVSSCFCAGSLYLAVAGSSWH